MSLPISNPFISPLPQQLLNSFIADKDFPCVGAKSALNKSRLRFVHAGAMGTSSAAQTVVQWLYDFAEEFDHPGTVPVSLIATFESIPTSEVDFEERLWAQLSAMHAYDHALGYPWDRSVSSDAARQEFSFSIGGRAYFVVGLHPGASRLARRTPVPCLVFNFHQQFEALKASGKYQSMQTAIRARDIALQGNVNPVLSRFGESSEARQYSGRAVEQSWTCPFQAREK
jgi:FPC/CPF motif-containing protein YcgG